MRHAVIVALLLTWVVAPGATMADDVATVGQPPPLFALPDEDGTVHALADAIGKPIILYFTHNMCHYCTQVVGFLKRAHETYAGTDLTIITLNVWARDGEVIRRYREAYELPFVMLAANDRDLLRAYEVNYVPIIVFIDRGGTIRDLYHHYILPRDFDSSTARIVASGSPTPGP